MKITILGKGIAGCLTALHYGYHTRHIKNISIEVGYENDSFFSRLFKIKTGMTPSKWRSSD